MPERFHFGGAAFNVEDGVLESNGTSRRLGPRTAEVLLVFLRSGGRVLSKTELMQAVWSDAFVEDGNLTYHIHQLRQFLGKTPSGDEFIETLPRRGYRFLPEVAAAAELPLVAEPGAPEDAPPVPGETDRPNSSRLPQFAVALTLTLLVVGLSMVGLESVRGPSNGPSFAVSGMRQVTTDLRLKDSGTQFVRIGSSIAFRWSDFGSALLENSAVRERKEFAGFTLMDYSPARGEYLAMRIDDPGAMGTTWILSKDGRGRRRLGNVIASYAAWSPDGERVAYTWQEHLYVVNPDGGGKRELTGFAGRPADVSWSPDGSTLRFTVRRAINRKSASELWEMELTDAIARRLLPGWDDVDQCCGVWSPDGRNYAFETIRSGHHSVWAFQERQGIWKTVRSTPVQISPATLNVSTPEFSDDGAQLFVFAWSRRGELQRYDVKTSAFSPHLGGVSATHASHSRDGKWVTYVSYPDNELWRARADGSEPRQLTEGGNVDGCYFSPDGRFIAFRAGFNGPAKRIYVIPSDGSSPAEPLTTRDIEQGIATWSADGRYLVYGDVPEDYTRPTDTRLRLHDIEGGTTQEIPASAGMWTSRWSPDGRYIAAVDRHREYRLTLFDTSAQQWRPLPEATNVDYPNWSSDSRYIYYSVSGLPRQELRRVAVASGKVESLVNLQEANILTAYYWSGVTADDLPTVLRLEPPQVSVLTLQPR